MTPGKAVSLPSLNRLHGLSQPSSGENSRTRSKEVPPPYPGGCPRREPLPHPPAGKAASRCKRAAVRVAESEGRSSAPDVAPSTHRKVRAA